MKTEELVLTTPVKINGEDVSKLSYNTDEITAEMFCSAALEAEKITAGKGVGTVMEIDAILHMHLGFKAIMAVNPKIDENDLMRIKGKDVIKITRIGRNFITKSAAETSAGENLEEQSETIADSTIQA